MTTKRDREELLSTADVARCLGITPEGVRYLERRGKVKAARTRSGQRIFRLEDVEQLARDRGVSGGDPLNAA